MITSSLVLRPIMDQLGMVSNRFSPAVVGPKVGKRQRKSVLNPNTLGARYSSGNCSGKINRQLCVGKGSLPSMCICQTRVSKPKIIILRIYTIFLIFYCLYLTSSTGLFLWFCTISFAKVTWEPNVNAEITALAHNTFRSMFLNNLPTPLSFFFYLRL